MTFSFRPPSSRFGRAVPARVVSWNEPAEMNESVDSDALVMPRATVGRGRDLPSAS